MVKREKHESIFTALYRRNEMFLISSAAIFLSSILLGYFLSNMIEPLMGSILKQFKYGIQKGEIKLTTPWIFAHNLKAAFFIYAGGFLVGIGTILFLFINGVFIGYVASKVPIFEFILLTLPHGIFEALGIIIAGVAGFRLASCMISFFSGILDMGWEESIIPQIKYLVTINLEEFRESLIILGIAVVLLAIAAVIEANFTILWADYVKSIT